MVKISKDMNKVAAIIPNYNMPERTDALAEYIMKHAKSPYDLYIVDNGSDLVPPSKYTNVWIKENCQTTCGWLTGLEEADKHGPYFAYWVLITSTEFVAESKDPLTLLVNFLVNNPSAAVVHAALTTDSTTALSWMISDGAQGPRRVQMVDNIAALWRADHLNSIGRFRRELTMAWGVLPETCWKARQAGKTIWIHEGMLVKKVSNIGYDMDRMNMTAKERRMLADQESKRVLEPIYGKDYLKTFGQD